MPTPNIRLLRLLSFALLVATASVLPAADWSRFRGPNGSGVSSEAGPLPEKWSATENLRWKVPLPGPGSSSPIIVGNRLYLTCWTGYGANGPARGASQDSLKRHLLCLDATTGKTLWDKSVPAVLPEDTYSGQFAEHGYASHTPVSDGERIYVFYGKTGALAYDLDGNQLWQTSLGTGLDATRWGSAASPVLYKNLVIIVAAAESHSLVALDKTTGKEVWKNTGREYSASWGTPILITLADGHTEMVLGIPNKIMGLNPETGEQLWHCRAFTGSSLCSSVIADGDVIFGIEGGGGSIAVRAGGKGDVQATHVVWTGRDRGRIVTPVLHEGRLYHFSNNNKVVTCIDAKTGEHVYQSRLGGGSAEGGGRGGRGGGMGGQDYGSPIVADGKLYFVNRTGTAYVLKPGPEYVQLAVNQLTDDDEDFSATPAVADGRLFIRSSAHLYSIAAEKP